MLSRGHTDESVTFRCGYLILIPNCDKRSIRTGNSESINALCAPIRARGLINHSPQLTHSFIRIQVPSLQDDSLTELRTKHPPIHSSTSSCSSIQFSDTQDNPSVAVVAIVVVEEFRVQLSHHHRHPESAHTAPFALVYLPKSGTRSSTSTQSASWASSRFFLPVPVMR
jgi:hypothetical protein